MPPVVVARDADALFGRPPGAAEPDVPGGRKGAQERLAPRRRARQELPDAGAGPGKVDVLAGPEDALDDLEGQLPLQVRGLGLPSSGGGFLPLLLVCPVVALLASDEDDGRRALLAALAGDPDGCQLHPDDGDDALASGGETAISAVVAQSKKTPIPGCSRCLPAS